MMRADGRSTFHTRRLGPRRERPRKAITILLFFLLAALAFLGLLDPGSSEISYSLLKGERRESAYLVRIPEGGGMDPSMQIEVPGGGHITHTSLNLRPVPGSRGPERVYVDVGLDRRVEWAFGGGFEGSFGFQDRFYRGNEIQRMISSGRGDPLSIYLPDGVLIRSSEITARSPPSPEGGGNRIIHTGTIDISSPETMDTADLDGDGVDELIYYSRKDGAIYCLHLTRQGSYVRIPLNRTVSGVISLRAIGRSAGTEGGVVFSRNDPSNSSSEISILHGDLDEGFVAQTISRDLPPNSSGFSLKKELWGGYSLIVIDGGTRRLMDIRILSNSTITSSTLLDSSIPSSGIVEGDIDGDGDRDLVQFPPSAAPDNITILEAFESPNGIDYEPVDTGISVSAQGLGVAVDADGDGREEIYINSAIGRSPGVLYLAENGKALFNWLGMNGSAGSFRTVPDGAYGKDGAYGGGEGLLCFLTNSGIRHLLPESSPDGTYLVRKSISFSSFAIMENVDSDGDGHILTVSGGSLVRRYDLKWSADRTIVLKNRGEQDRISYLPTSGGETDISDVLSGKGDRYAYKDEYGNSLTKWDILAFGSGHMITLKGLGIEYDGSFDVSTSTLFLPAVRKGLEDFQGDRVPISVGGDSAGSISVGPVLVIYDSPPRLSSDLPLSYVIEEGSSDTGVYPFFKHVTDDYLSGQELEMNVLAAGETPCDLIYADGTGSLRARTDLYPDLHGEFGFSMVISDMRNSITTPDLKLVILPVNDPPVVVNPHEDIFLPEGMSLSVPLSGSGGIFHDPDGDELHYHLAIKYSLHQDMDAVKNVRIIGDELVITSQEEGSGGSFTVEVSAYDGRGDKNEVAVSAITVTLINVDAPLEIRDGPGFILLVEDQSTSSKIPISGWFHDPDSPLSAYEISLHPSDSRLEADTVYVGGEPYIALLPTMELSGRVDLMVQLTMNDISTSDLLAVDIEPTNDIPEVFVTDQEVEDDTGWIITGMVSDPDSRTGIVEYRIDGGEWKTARGFGGFSFTIPFSAIDRGGSSLEVRAFDGTDYSRVEYLRTYVQEELDSYTFDRDGDGVPDILDAFPFDPDEQYDTDGDCWGDNGDAFPYDPGEHLDTDGDGVGDNSDYDPLDPNIRTREDTYTPPPSSNNGKEDDGLFVLFGFLGGLSALIGFIIWTEVGLVTFFTLGSTLYSKLSRKDILNHEVRGLIRGYIIANPGDHYSSIKRNLDLNNGTLAYHLRVLEQNGFIKSLYDGIYKRYYPSNVNIHKVKRNVSKQEEIFNIILDKPGTTMEEIGRMLGVSRQVVNYHVKNLIRTGLITYDRDKKSARFYPSDNSHEA